MAKRLTIQRLIRSKGKAPFAPSALCLPTNRSTKLRTSHTPNAKANHCLFKARAGHGKGANKMYVAIPKREKNPRIRGSSVPTGIGTRGIARWEQLYNANTKKAIRPTNVPKYVPDVLMNVLY